MTAALVAKIQEAIGAKWSPEQIGIRLKEKGIFISHETIYKMIWADKRAGGILYKYLRHHGKRYNKRSSGKAGRGCIPGRIDISERPKIVEEKSRIGDWEGDTIIGAKHQGAIVSYVDRHSKFTLLKKIDRKEVALVLAATLEKTKGLPHKVETINFDNGKEFARHQEISIALTRIFHTDLLRKPGRPMTAALDSGLSLDSMYTYSPALKSSSALPHQPSLLPRHNQYEISGLTACCYFAEPYHSYMIFFGSLEAQLVGFSENGHPKFVGGGSLPAGLKTKIGYQSTK